MRCPRSLGNGLNSRPGSSRWSLTHFTILAIGTSSEGCITRPSRRLAAQGRRAGWGQHDTVRGDAAALGSPAPAPGQSEGSPSLDHLMAAASNRYLLLAVAGGM